MRQLAARLSSFLHLSFAAIETEELTYGEQIRRNEAVIDFLNVKKSPPVAALLCRRSAVSGALFLTVATDRVCRALCGQLTQTNSTALNFSFVSGGNSKSETTPARAEKSQRVSSKRSESFVLSVRK